MVPLRFRPGAFVLLLGCLSIPAAAFGQDVALSFQTVNTSPRSHGLGEAAVAQRGYAGALQLNPATIGRAQTVQLYTTFQADPDLTFRTPWSPWRGVPGGPETWIATPSFDVKRGRSALAYEYREFSLGGHAYRDAPDQSPGTSRSYQRSHELAYARDVTPRLALGVGVSLIHSRLARPVEPGASPGADYDGTSFSLDLGAYYARPVQTASATVRPALAWSLTDFGRRLYYPGEAFGDPLPMVMRAGASLEVAPRRGFFGRPLVTMGLSGALSKVLVRYEAEEGDDGSVRYQAHGPFRALFTAWKPLEVPANAAERETLGTWAQVRKHGGLELSLLRILWVRWGHQAESRYLGGRTYDTFGWSVDLYYLVLERSRGVPEQAAFGEAAYWALTARLPIGPAPDNFWPALLRGLRGRSGR